MCAEEAPWICKTKDVEYGAARQEEKRKTSVEEVVKEGWCDRGGC